MFEVEIFNKNEFYFRAIDKFRQNLISRIRILAVCIRSTLIAIAINLKQYPLFCGDNLSEAEDFYFSINNFDKLLKLPSA